MIGVCDWSLITGIMLSSAITLPYGLGIDEEDYELEHLLDHIPMSEHHEQVGFLRVWI